MSQVPLKINCHSVDSEYTYFKPDKGFSRKDIKSTEIHKILDSLGMFQIDLPSFLDSKCKYNSPEVVREF
jgi:hypothetical protein